MLFRSGATQTRPATGFVVATQIGSKRIGRLSSFTRLKTANLSGTAEYAYDPTYRTDGRNGIIVRLGNNGRLQLSIPKQTNSDNPGTDPEDPKPDQPEPEHPNQPADPSDPSHSEETNPPTDEKPSQSTTGSASNSNHVPDSGVTQGTGSLSVAFIVVMIAGIAAAIGCVSYLHWRNER